MALRVRLEEEVMPAALGAELAGSAPSATAAPKAKLDGWPIVREWIRPVQLFHRTIAIMLLLGWLFATGHVVAGHGGEGAQSAQHETIFGHADDDHHDAPAPDSHQHDLTATATQPANPAAQLAALSVCAPLCDALVERLAAMLREAAEPRRGIGIGDSPLDERSSGWLLVCQTAHPVRGPSLAV